jgi:hypothetical protein
LEKRPFKPVDISKPGSCKAAVPQCKFCKHGTGYRTTQESDIPEPLRGLTDEALKALRPIEIDVGRYCRGDYGYRVHTDMVRFRWSKTSVEEKIRALPRRHRKIAEAAYNFLADDEVISFRSLAKMEEHYIQRPSASSYTAFLDMHAQTLRRLSRRDGAEGGLADPYRLPPRFLETVGLECAVWPHLYPTVGMTETFVRSQDARRLARHSCRRRAPKAKARAARAGSESTTSSSSSDDRSDNDEAPLHVARDGNNSLKASFLAKVLGPVIGYGADHELVQFVYDLSLWSALGGAKHAASVPLRVAMSGKSFSPEFWKLRHAALLDLQKQIGFPSLFITVSPFEWSTPYHFWLEDEMIKTLKSRTYLPVAETLHLAHVLAQLVGGLLTGWGGRAVHGRSDRTWAKHVLSNKEGGAETVVNFYGRLEFQDGKRKRGNPNARSGGGTLARHTFQNKLPLSVWLWLHMRTSQEPGGPREHLVSDLAPGSFDEHRFESLEIHGSRSGPLGHCESCVIPSRHHCQIHEPTKRCRKRLATERHDYHGSGRPHVHLLVWLRDIPAVRLPDIVCATVPDEDENAPLRRIVLDSQKSWTGSGWDTWAGDSEWDAKEQVLKLKHTATDKAMGIRAFMPDVIGAMCSQMDVQASDGRGALLRYCATYVPKFSDSFAKELLNDHASDYAVARRVLTEYHPLEPEMTLQLGAHLFPQVFAGGTMKKFVCPVPWGSKPLPEIVNEYKDSAWRRDDMTLREYLRRANAKGEILKHIRQRHRRAETEDSLQDFANAFTTAGEVMVAAVCSSRFSDEFYGQALLLDVPFRSLNDLWREEAERVPVGYRMFALCLLLRPDFWRNLDRVRAVMELEAYRDHFVESNIAMIRAHTEIVDAYLDGDMDVGRDEPPPRQAYLRGGDAADIHLDLEQWRVVNAIDNRVQTALAMANQDFGEEGGEDAAFHFRTPYAVLGPAGSGKSTAIQVAMKICMEKDARVVLACPTRMLVATYRDKMPDLDVDSVHAVFGIFKPEQDTLDAMAFFDLVVIEEVGQLSCEVFERIMRLWDAAGRRPALVFVGDFAQLKGVEPSRALDSPRWLQVMKFTLLHMRRCQCSELKWKLELLRTAKPTAQQLRQILRGHRAPSSYYRDQTEGSEPTDQEIVRIFIEKPHTTFVTISRRAAAWVNSKAVAAFFGGQAPLRTVGGDPDANPENYDGVVMSRSEPMPIQIYIGLRIAFTRNVCKEMDYVNGMGGVVQAVLNSGIVVRTDTGYTVVVYPWTDEDRNVFHPIRLGYAHTLLKVQGATLDHATFYLDSPGIEAAGYVALSRVRRDADWQFVGGMSTNHFLPARLY